MGGQACPRIAHGPAESHAVRLRPACSASAGCMQVCHKFTNSTSACCLQVGLNAVEMFRLATPGLAVLP